jgi:phospholipid/cholesterol/gamma-HCH transport system substrate-binding protein
MNHAALATAAAVTLVAASVCSCAAVDLSAIPLPGNSYADGYDVTIQFDSVLNLPDKAKVVMDGTKIGVVDRVAIKRDAVDVEVRVDDSVLIPANARAALQQDTVLGDIYIALNRDPAGETSVTPLPRGGVITLQNTASPPQLEDTIAVLANFVTSGSIQHIQDTIAGINAVTPGTNKEVQRLAAQIAADLNDLSDNLDQVDIWLAGVTGTAEVLQQRSPLLSYYVSPEGMRGWDHSTFVSTYISTLLPSIGSIYEGGFWLVPMLNSLADATGAVKQSGLDVIDDGAAWQHLLSREILPFLRHPSVDITSITGPDGTQLAPDVERLLRLLGAIR